MDEGLAWEVSLQGLDVASGELVNGVRKECENSLTLTNLYCGYSIIKKTIRQHFILHICDHFRDMTQSILTLKLVFIGK